MNWNELLQQASPDPRTVSTEDCAFAPLASAGLIRVKGEDARSFLQGQLTNDIEAIDTEQAQLSAWCTPKGRMLALFLIFQREDDLYLLLPRERLEAVLKRLRMFVLRARVSLEDASDELVTAGAWGGCLSDVLDRLPAESFHTTTARGLTLIRLPGDDPHLQLIGEPEALVAFWQQMAGKGSLANEANWTLQNIRAGLPAVLDATAEAFIPQMLNLDVLDGISFTKGCYTGQEVVARMKYLGQLKRRMYLAQVDDPGPLSPGDLLWSPESRSAQGAGKVVMAAEAPSGGHEALVVAEISVAGKGDMRIGDENGPRVRLSPPPYEVPELKE
ncbi:CAF17-like 4Fe-4S cluster assembly/insertion protein YgfZ [Thiolapillus brandeum]|uniref:GCVT N-terminal domain-containing protein n=1 Tax=Thiolapillus brandeum TaxID=1076588 RepID=A0A7U6JHS5_9GAMM|nr:folate-binding protein YgfZ [Thiolapillus brandeum]BAO44107.1 conserved hypothetical protein [Thiolapillus brandeum]